MAVPKRFSHDPSYVEFFTTCLLPNVPGVFPPAFVEKKWPAYKSLRSEELGTTAENAGRLHPAFDWLSNKFGSQTVPVVTQSATHDELKEEMQEMTVSDAVFMMRQSASSGTVHYIKDWHLFLRLEQSSPPASQSPGGLYTVHPCFQDDWMNHPLLINPSTHEDKQAARTDDFRFCYAGQKGTQTHLHADVYTSYSWSTNLVGRKRWRMFPPDVSLFLRRFPPSSAASASSGKQVQEARTSQLARNVDALDSGEHGKGWSRYHKAREKMIEFVQEPGETVFVPSNWYHEVLNLDDCISINHNWCNSVNLPSMFAAMEDEVEDVEKSLEDVKQMIQMRYKAEDKEEAWRREWTETVQEVVKQDMGWAWQGFWKMVEVNLRPVAQPSVRPDWGFIHLRISDIVSRFIKRSDYPYLDESTLISLRACQELLRS